MVGGSGEFRGPSSFVTIIIGNNHPVDLVNNQVAHQVNLSANKHSNEMASEEEMFSYGTNGREFWNDSAMEGDHCW